MLNELRIENFAIIQKLELNFSSGLVIFTGETGAGKSIILDAIEALVGGKTDTTMVRSGADRANLEAVFQIPPEFKTEIRSLLSKEDLDESNTEVTLGREIRLEGRTIARINGHSVNVGLLKDLGQYLVDIHGQSEHLSLLNVKAHLGLLDRFAGVENELSAYQEKYHALRSIRHELETLRRMESEAGQRMELLQFQAQEIREAHLFEGEEEELDQERARLANAETLSASAQQAITLLDEGAPESPSVSDLLGQAGQLIHALARIDPSRQGLADQLESAVSQLSDVSAELTNYLEQVEYNPRRLEQVEERLELIHRLKRKYGGNTAAVNEFGRNASIQLENITHAGEKITELETREANLISEVQKQGEILSQKRQAAAQALEQGVEIELADLSMAGARFKVHFTRNGDADASSENNSRTEFTETGLDGIEFFIAPNPGEGLKPLTRIASGGETSRLMLALKDVLANADFIPTLIFDEIDQGIGGRVGNVVGQKLWSLGRKHQVMCVTHLPQLAAYGDQHYRVRKLVHEGRTSTEVKQLDGDQRIAELAQMTGSVTEATLQASAEIVENARSFSKQS